MTEHADEVIKVLLWALLGGGALFLALAKWIASQLMRKLEGIEAAIHATNTALNKIDHDLRTDVVSLERRHESRIVEVERRVSDLHTRCAIYHQRDKD
jgi:hypothetical protein